METASSSAPTAGVRDDQGERPHQLAAQAEPHSLGATSQGLETRSTRQGLETRAAATEPPRLGKNFTDTGASQNVGRPSNLSSASKVEESHSKAESMSIPIPSKPVSQPQSQPHSGEATSPSTPPHGPQTGTPPREGILSTAARAALEGRQSSRRDATCHSPSPSRRRPPLSPSSSSGGMTPPKPQGAPSPKPQKMFHNPYAKSPFRVTGFNPGSPRAPVPVTQLSAETENELLQATQRGLFSDDDVAESERSPRDSGGGFQSASGGLHESTAKAGGPSQRVEELGISGRGPGGFVTCEKGSENEPSDLLGTSPEMSKMDISGEDADAGESAVTRNEEAELESRKRKSEESPEKVRGGASGSMEVREQPDLKQPQLSSPIGKESEEEASHSGRISGTPYRQTDSAFLQTPHMTAAHPAAGLRSKQSEFQRATGNEPGEAEGRLPQAHSSLPPKPELSASSRVPSFDGGNKRSARDRWRRARLHVAAARAFAYGSGLGGFSEVTEPETSGAAFRTKLELAGEGLRAEAGPFYW